MIFATVGAQMPFDRLVRGIDEWAAARGRPDVFAQIGFSDYYPRQIQTIRFLGPVEFRERVKAAELIVAHAGMGSIITALEFGKPIVIMARRGDLGETRNDHQLATAKHFARQGRVIVALDESELPAKLDHAATLPAAERIGCEASQSLIATIRAFLEQGLAAPSDGNMNRLNLDFSDARQKNH